MLHKLFTEAWWHNSKWLYILTPLEWIYALFYYLNYQLHTKITTSHSLQIPLIVVGGITVGGAGKTPATISIAKSLMKHGFKVGIISRGYKGNAKAPTELGPYSKAAEVGDEASMISQISKCPVFVGKKRYLAATSMLNRHKLDVIISDDGLQHYALKANVNIAVIDGRGGLSNNHLLPVGPLRESKNRLKKVDFILLNIATNQNKISNKLARDLEKIDTPKFFIKHHSVSLVKITEELFTKKEPEAVPIAQWKKMYETKNILALAGIAQPNNFFANLREHGISFRPFAFPNHHEFNKNDLAKINKHKNDVIVMTEKDAVKFKDLISPKIRDNGTNGFNGFNGKGKSAEDAEDLKDKLKDMWALRLNHQVDDKLIRQIISIL